MQIVISPAKLAAFTDADWDNLHRYLPQLGAVLHISALRAKQPLPTEDIDITCDVCADQQFWQDNYDGAWQAARWWFCGPAGLGCQGF